MSGLRPRAGGAARRGPAARGAARRGKDAIFPPLRGLLVAQFLGAFDDNAWKLIVALLAMKAAAGTGSEGPAYEAASQSRTTLTFLVFTLPLMLGSLPAGALAERVSKRTGILAMKAAEVCLMAARALALLVSPGGWILPLLVLGGMGVHSGLFSPAKDGIRPELLPHERLSRGNGILELTTFLAIIAGPAAGGLLPDLAGASPWTAGANLAILAPGGFLASWTVPRVPPGARRGSVPPSGSPGRRCDRTGSSASPCRARSPSGPSPASWGRTSSSMSRPCWG